MLLTAPPGWDEFIEWAGRFHGRSDFKAEERDYKIEGATLTVNAITAAKESTDWIEPLHRALKNAKNNLVSHWVYLPFLDWVAAEPDTARQALLAFSPSDLDAPQRIELFDNTLPRHVLPGMGGRCNLASYFLGQPLDWPPYRVTAMNHAYELTRTAALPDSARPHERYAHALGFFDEVIEQASARGMTLLDRLDAQSVTWCVTHWHKDRREDEFSHEDWQALLEYRTLPAMLRKEHPPKKPGVRKSRPLRALCHLCASDEEVTFLGPLGDKWLFSCEAGPGHQDPYEFTRG